MIDSPWWRQRVLTSQPTSRILFYAVVITACFGLAAGAFVAALLT